MTLHPIVESAADGRLPHWTEAASKRRAHMGRVAELMERWARAWELEEAEVRRWRALGLLHDVLRDADPAELRRALGAEWNGAPPQLLHGPAGAERLRSEGLDDPSFLTAVAFHTIGHPELDRMGRALYCADFLEPGRRFLTEWRGSLRERMPTDSEGVLGEVLDSRIARLRERGGPIRPETEAFQARVARGAGT